MPDLDVSFMCSDPMLADTFSIKRRAQTVSAKGRAVNTPTVIPNVVGVVTQHEPSDLVRLQEGDVVKNVITVCTQTQMFSAVGGYAPDVITWNGMDYLVTEVLPYSRFGAGTYEVRAESMTNPAAPQ